MMRNRTQYLIAFIIFFLVHLAFAIYFSYIDDSWGAVFVVMIADFPISNLVINRELLFLGEKELLVLSGSIWYGLIGMFLYKIFKKFRNFLTS